MCLRSFLFVFLNFPLLSCISSLFDNSLLHKLVRRTSAYSSLKRYEDDDDDNDEEEEEKKTIFFIIYSILIT